VDNLCHSLVGAAMSAAGLRRRTGLATATMVIGANLPDVDALVYLLADGTTALAFRRGWTHGVLAMAVLPVVLAAAMVGVGRVLSTRRSRRTRASAHVAVVPSQLLLLSAISVWSHPLFDLLNTYGVRLLMPFSSRWFYGDAVFIVDPWLWLVLGVGAVVSLRRARAVPVGAASRAVMTRAERPARVAVAIAGAYIGAMLLSSTVGRVMVERQARGAGGAPSRHVMVSPEPVTPFNRGVVRDLGGTYELGRLTWSIPPRYATTGRIPARLDTPAALTAARALPARQFLSWSRFPFADVDAAGPATVHFDDARYATPGTGSWAGVTIPVADGLPDSR
jgi:inner membrane protein